MKTPDIKTVTDTALPIVNRLLIAIAKAELEREKIDIIYNKILAENAFYNEHNGHRIVNHKFAYLMNDTESNAFFALCNAAIIAAGYKVPEGNCPACMAEHDQTKIEWELLKATCPLFDIDWQTLYGENRKKWLDLTIGTVIKSPSYKNPLTGKAA